MEAHFPPFNAVNRAQSSALGAGSYGPEEASRVRSTVGQPTPSGGPLSTLAQQLQRVSALRQHVGTLAERVIGPRGISGESPTGPTVYGGILGAVEGEAETLRRNINEMMDDLSAIESALS